MLKACQYLLWFSLLSCTVYAFCAEYEAGMIRLLDKLTNGSKIEINQTGKQIADYSCALFTFIMTYCKFDNENMMLRMCIYKC